MLRTVLVAPMTTKGLAASFRVPTKFAGRDGRIALDQLRALDKGRLLRRLGTIGEKTLDTVLERLAEIFAP
jgi:mRNA interferase MazF